MAITNITELMSLTGAETHNQVDFTRRFQIEFSTRYEGAATVFASTDPRLPRIGQPYTVSGGESWTSAIVRSRSYSPGGSPVGATGIGTYGILEVQYSTRGDSGDTSTENPLLQRAIISVGTNRYQKPMQYDRQVIRDDPPYGKRVANSAGQDYNPPPEIDDSRIAIRIAKNLPYVNFDALRAAKDAVNYDWFLGAPPYALKIADLRAQENRWDNAGSPIYYYAWEVELEVNDELWHPLYVWDAGTQQLGVDESDLIPIRIGSSRKAVDTPHPLDGSGHYLDRLNGESIIEYERRYVYNAYQAYNLISFNALGIYP